MLSQRPCNPSGRHCLWTRSILPLFQPRGHDIRVSVRLHFERPEKPAMLQQEVARQRIVVADVEQVDLPIRGMRWNPACLRYPFFLPAYTVVFRDGAIPIDDGIGRVLSAVVVADADLPCPVHRNARKELIATSGREIG